MLGLHQCISKNNHEVTKWLISDHPLHPLCSIHPFFIISDVITSCDLIISDVIFDSHLCLTSKFQFRFFIRKTIRREKVHKEVQSQRLIKESVIDVLTSSKLDTHVLHMKYKVGCSEHRAPVQW